MDKISSAQRSENMKRIRSRDTSPELTVRRTVYSLGYRYRLNVKFLPGKPDLVFSKKRKVIFVHGCFWHQHAACPDSHKPKSNTLYWTKKLQRNVERDKATEASLKEQGWDILVIWECEVSKSDLLKENIQNFLIDKF